MLFCFFFFSHVKEHFASYNQNQSMRKKYFWSINFRLTPYHNNTYSHIRYEEHKIYVKNVNSYEDRKIIFGQIHNFIKIYLLFHAWLIILGLNLILYIKISVLTLHRYKWFSVDIHKHVYLIYYYLRNRILRLT